MPATKQNIERIKVYKEVDGLLRRINSTHKDQHKYRINVYGIIIKMLEERIVEEKAESLIK